MPSPTCEVKDGAAAYVATTNGVDVTPSNTIVIRLASLAGVTSWLIECATTDDTSDAATVSASLSIDPVLRTATYTAPAAGKTYRFRSRVNGGVDLNGVAQPSYTTTFIVCTLTGGRRVIAADETTEGDATFGWIKWLNDLIRNPPGSSTTPPGGASGQVQFNDGASFAGASGLLYDASSMRTRLHSAIVSTATLTSAMISQATLASAHLVAPVARGAILGATTVYTGTDIRADGDAYHKSSSAIRSALTTDATVTPLLAFRLRDEAVTSVFLSLHAVPSGGFAGGSYGRRLRIWANDGAATCGSVESSWTDEVTAVGFTGVGVGSGIHIGLTGMTGFINVMGGATGVVRWGGTVTIEETAWSV